MYVYKDVNLPSSTCLKILMHILALGSASPLLIRNKLGISKSKVDKCIDFLLRNGYIRKIDRGSYVATDKGKIIGDMYFKLRISGNDIKVFYGGKLYNLTLESIKNFIPIGIPDHLLLKYLNKLLELLDGRRIVSIEDITTMLTYQFLINGYEEIAKEMINYHIYIGSHKTLDNFPRLIFDKMLSTTISNLGLKYIFKLKMNYELPRVKLIFPIAYFSEINTGSNEIFNSNLFFSEIVILYDNIIEDIEYLKRNLKLDNIYDKLTLNIYLYPYSSSYIYDNIIKFKEFHNLKSICFHVKDIKIFSDELILRSMYNFLMKGNKLIFYKDNLTNYEKHLMISSEGYGINVTKGNSSSYILIGKITFSLREEQDVDYLIKTMDDALYVFQNYYKSFIDTTLNNCSKVIYFDLIFDNDKVIYHFMSLINRFKDGMAILKYKYGINCYLSILFNGDVSSKSYYNKLFNELSKINGYIRIKPIIQTIFDFNDFTSSLQTALKYEYPLIFFRKG